jgi:ankyrin repeat protein
VVRLLLQHGADPNARGRSGLTPLEAARHSPNEDALELLRQHGAAE